MHITAIKEKNTYTVTVTLGGYKNFKDRVKYKLGQMENILREKYDLEKYELVHDQSTRKLSNFNGNGIGTYVFELQDLAAKPAIVTKKEVTTKAKRKTKAMANKEE